MKELFTIIASSVDSQGWENGIDAVIEGREAREVSVLGNGMFSEFRQGSWAIYLGDLHGKKVLNIDGSFGASSMVLARLGADVTTLHRAAPFGRAVSSRLGTDARTKVRMVVGDLGERIPFLDRAFDVACIHNLNLIADLHDLHPFDPERLIGRMAGLLKGNGILYCSGLKRSVSEPWSRDPGRMFCRMLRALRKAGLEAKILFNFYPTILYPEILRTFYPLRSGGSLAETMRTFLTAGNFGLVAGPAGRGRPRSRVEEVFSRIKKNGVHFRATASRLHLGSKSVLRMVAGDRLIRIPLSELGIASCLANRKALKRLEGECIPFHVPKAMEHSLDPIPFFCEERVVGDAIPEESLTPMQVSQYLEQGIDILDRLYRDRTWKPFDEETFRKHVGKVLDFIGASMNGEEREAVTQADTLLRNRYMGIKYPVALSHGDYKIPNFLADSKKDIHGVVDWDRFDEQSPILIDGILLLSHSDSLYRRRNWIQSVLSVDDSPYWSFLRGHMLRNGVEPGLIRFYVILAAMHIIRHNGRLNISYPTWRRECIHPVLKYIMNKIS